MKPEGTVRMVFANEKRWILMKSDIALCFCVSKINFLFLSHTISYPNDGKDASSKALGADSRAPPRPPWKEIKDLSLIVHIARQYFVLINI